MIWINIKLALSSIRGSKIRAFMTMLAVIIGVFAFVIITTTVDGLKSSVATEINSLGANLVAITPGQTVTRNEEGEIESFNFAASFGASTLTEKDLLTIQETENVIAAAPQMLVSGVVTRQDKELSGSVIMATNSSYPTAFNQNTETGTFLPEDNDKSNVAVIGRGVVDELFAGTVSLGSTITIRKQTFTIIGVMEEVEIGFGFGPDINRAIFIPFETGKDFNGGTALIQEIDAQLDENADVDVVVADMKTRILENHGGEEDFTIIKQDEILGVTENIFDLIKNVSRWVSYIMLFVGGVVIMLIMLITVTERTREIGIRKSIGATNSNILVQFLTEAIVLTWIGSLLGILLSFLVGLIITALADITPAYSLNTMILVLLISTFIGAVAGIVPAFKAAQKDPIEALRHD